MDAVTFIRQALTQVHERLMATLDGLTEADVTWRPAPAANTILEIVWHVARADDRMGRRRTGLGPELWDQGWSARFGEMSDIRSGDPYQFLKGDGIVAPRLDDIKAYLSALHRDTDEKLRGLTPADLDRVPDPERPERSVATYFRHMITHKNNHHGQVDFIKGLRQPEWNLTPGTGLVQP
jgi:DinB family protein